MHTDMKLARSLKWTAALLLTTVLLVVVFIALFGWNWLRGPLERMTLEKTGRQLAIGGDLELKLGWPRPHLLAGAVTFANPLWASEKMMVTADVVDIAIDGPELLLRHVVLPEVRLVRPVLFLERGSSGQKNWLLDLNQQDEGARIQVDRLTLDHGQIGFDDAQQQTRIRAELSTSYTESGGAGLGFSAQGQYKGLALQAHGVGGPVLGLGDEDSPYSLKAEITVGRTVVKVDGSITNLLKFSAMDLQLALHGDNLAQLFPLLGIAFPVTRTYATDGHLEHSGKTWRYQKFTGRIGDSDVAGTLQLDTGGKRPAMTAELVSKVLDVADLGTLIGERPGQLQAARKAAPIPSQNAAPLPVQARVLPDLPFKSDHWDSVDAEVTLSAKAIRRAKELPLENLSAHLSLRDSVLTLDPLNFGLAGGQLNAVISLDGRHDPIQAKARVRAKKILLARMFPAVKLNNTSIGQINGEFELAGVGNTVGRMLASANGKVGLVVDGGLISKLMMEEVGLHLWEILALNLTGDKQIKLRCAVADFDVRQGIMHANALIFDTEVTTVIGSGSIDLGQEKIDLTLNQKTKNTSPLALRSPIYVRGSLAKPEVGVDKLRVAARALGAIMLGVVNPLLVMLPLVDAGPGEDSDCAQLLRQARAGPRPARTK